MHGAARLMVTERLVRFEGVVCTVALLLYAGVGGAHHSLGMFDTNRQIALEGVVSKFVWVNPHAEIYVDVADAAGQSTEWKIECGSLGMMIRGGWRANSAAPGDKIKLIVHPPRTDVKNLGELVTATFPDGRVLGAVAR